MTDRLLVISLKEMTIRENQVYKAKGANFTCHKLRVLPEPDDLCFRLGLLHDALELHHLVLLDLQPRTAGNANNLDLARRH